MQSFRIGLDSVRQNRARGGCGMVFGFGFRVETAAVCCDLDAGPESPFSGLRDTGPTVLLRSGVPRVTFSATTAIASPLPAGARLRHEAAAESGADSDRLTRGSLRLADDDERLDDDDGAADGGGSEFSEFVVSSSAAVKYSWSVALLTCFPISTAASLATEEQDSTRFNLLSVTASHTSGIYCIYLYFRPICLYSPPKMAYYVSNGEGRNGPPGSLVLARWAGWSGVQVGRHVKC